MKIMGRIFLYGIILAGLFGCRKDDAKKLDYYIRFDANGQSYELSYVRCYYIENSSIESYRNKTIIYGYESVQTRHTQADSLSIKTNLPFIQFMIPSNEIGNWNQDDSISYAVQINSEGGYSNSINKPALNSQLNIAITTYGNIGESCIGTFSGHLMNEHGDELIIENGEFKILVEE